MDQLLSSRSHGPDVPALESRKAYSLVLAAEESAPRYINHVAVETLAALAKWTPGPLIERMHYNPSSGKGPWYG